MKHGHGDLRYFIYKDDIILTKVPVDLWRCGMMGLEEEKAVDSVTSNSGFIFRPIGTCKDACGDSNTDGDIIGNTILLESVFVFPPAALILIYASVTDENERTF